MTTEEIRTMLAVLKSAYPSSFKSWEEEDVRGTVKVWKLFFEHEDAAIVNAAVVSLIGSRKEGYTPTIGEICEKIRELKAPDELTEQDAWALVSKACRNGYYGYHDEFEKLPLAVQQVVGAPEQLKAWSMVDQDELETVTASNFRKAYRTHVQREQEMERLPSAMREQLRALTRPVLKELTE